MNIKNADFWQDLVRLFPANEAGRSGSAVADTVCRVCDFSRFSDRLNTSMQRCRRTDTSVLLVLVQHNGVSDTSARLLQRLDHCLRANDSVCDAGDGKLALLLEDLEGAAMVPLVVEKLRAGLQGLKGSGKQQSSLVNLGAALFPVDGSRLDELWLSAESALQQAVLAGPGAYRLSPMSTRSVDTKWLELNESLCRALRAREFKLVYQPVVDLAARNVRALEVLLRWQHPQQGRLSAELFMPVLEDSGLIVPVGEWVMREACLLLKRLQAIGQDEVRVCVNVSARQLEDPGFLYSVLDAVHESGIGPGRLQLEFPEGVLGRQVRIATKLFPKLKRAGIRLALDGFAGGRFSLERLMALPVDLLKLDRSVTDNVSHNAVSRRVIAASLAMAEAGEMQVAAVAVEDAGQVAALDGLGLREAQGHWFYNPMCADDLLTALRC